MKIIKPSVALVDTINPAEIYNKLELCGRVAHQSESKGDPENFIRKIITLGHESVLEHVSLTFHIICDRAIQNELVRHRHASFTVESTRYVRYYDLIFVGNVNENFADETQTEYERFTMTKRELIRKVAQQNSLSEAVATRVIDSFLDAIKQAVIEGDKAQILGFGTFENRTRAARKGRNPRTGEKIDLPETTRLHFSPGKGFKKLSIILTD